MEELLIGMVGMDTSHSRIFAAMLNDVSHPLYIPGGRLHCGYPGGSPDFELSYSRVSLISSELQEQYGVELLNSIEEVAERSHAILLTSVDGRVHKEQFEVLAPYGKPIFIDKPLAVTSEDAKAIVEMAERYGTPFFSSSMLRFGGPLVALLGDESAGAILGADCSGPLDFQPTQPGLFWYGIHSAEMLYAALGEGCYSVRVICNDMQEWVVGQWKDGRIGTIRGNRTGGSDFYIVLHRERGSNGVNALGANYNAGHQQLLKNFIAMARGDAPPVRPSLTLELIRFIEAANESRVSGANILL
ncbi:Gfo/Idh/MocA family oxidoreductase [Paenibacillus sp. FSL R5-0345]|uniref:Gfo/Idh/MocA family protein n=1 Tax=unclassified Paenibacillus TaxID=185978 RepID=UPI0004F7D984|nr:Gfo/Idh/MocA family oxidoreductase [Paenibacillus sp. FSL R5-0345]AIQ34967.1 oxidoreductase [Paenibacillus sp. FSL R5-0345]